MRKLIGGIGVTLASVAGLSACNDSYNPETHRVTANAITGVYEWPFEQRLESKPGSGFILTEVINDDRTSCGFDFDGDLTCKTVYDDDYRGYLRNPEPLKQATKTLIGQDVELRFPVFDTPRDTESTIYSVERRVDVTVEFGNDDFSDVCAQRFKSEDFTQEKVDILNGYDAIRYIDEVSGNSILLTRGEEKLRINC